MGTQHETIRIKAIKVSSNGVSRDVESLGEFRDGNFSGVGYVLGQVGLSTGGQSAG